MEKTKVTQRDYYNDFIALAEAADRPDLVKFAESRIALLDKKAENKKPSAKQEENEVIKTKIENVLADGKALTVTEIVKALDVEVSGQKVSALLVQMKKADKVVRTEEKKIARFSLA